MNMAELLREECVQAGVTVADKAALLEAVAALAGRDSRLAGVDQARILNALREREALGSTGFEGGVAIPHCRLEAVRDFVVGLVTLPDGVDFASADGAPTRVAVFIVAPERMAAAHIRLLSMVANTLRRAGVSERLLAATGAAELRQQFLALSGPQPARPEPENWALLQVVTSAEPVLRSVLQVLAEIPGASEVVVEGRGAAEYLQHIPLFAGILGTANRRSYQLVLAALDRRFTNEAIRRLEQDLGPLTDRTDVMVAVQDLVYLGGVLSG